jgi:hypothetical protein
MLEYMADTEASGELPLYSGDTFDRAIAEGVVPRAATRG